MKVSKKIVVLLVFALFTTVAYGQKKKKSGFELKFILENTTDKEVYIANYYAGKMYIYDTLYVSPKLPYTFIWTLDSMPKRGVYVLAGESKAKYLDFFIDTARYFTIHWDIKQYEQQGIMANTVITGSPENAAAFAFMKQMSSFESAARGLVQKIKEEEEKTPADLQAIADWNEELNQYRERSSSYIDSFLNTNGNTLFGRLQRLMREVPYPGSPDGLDSNQLYMHYVHYKANHYFDNCDFSETALNNSPVFEGYIERYYDKDLIPIPDTIIKYTDILLEKAKDNAELFKYITWFVTNKAESSPYIGHDAIFVHMTRKYYQKGLCPWTDEAVVERMVERANVLEPILLGKVSPELIMPDTHNIYHSSYEFNTRYTILWFWNLECGHCKTATPKLVELYNRARKELDFEVFAVCDATDTTAWKKAIIEKQLPWLNVGRNTANINFRVVFDIQTTPTLFVLDREKKIVAKKLGVEQLEEFLRNDIKYSSKEK